MIGHPQVILNRAAALFDQMRVNTMDNDQPETSAAAPRPKLLHQVRDAVRRKHFSPRTESRINSFCVSYPH